MATVPSAKTETKAVVRCPLGMLRKVRISLKKLVERKMLQPIQPNARQYTIGFENSYLMRGVIHALSQENFISAPLQGVRE